MEICFSKTEAGRLELRSRAHELSRTARNLLFVLDQSRSAREWLGMVQGATQDDLQALVRFGLIESAQAARSGPKTAPSPLVPPQAPVTPLTYSVLYERLTASGKQHLGLMKGYKFVLEVERCAGIDELEALARRFIAEVKQTQGAAIAAQIHRQLGLAGEP